MLSKTWILAALAAASLANAFSASDLTLSKDSVKLSGTFKYAVPGYDFRPHHARTPFAVSSGNGNAYVAYGTGSTVYVQQVDHANNFAAVGSPVAVPGLRAGGLVAHDDGFALLTTRSDGTTVNNEPTTYLVRYTSGKESWATPLNGNKAADDGDLTTSSDVLDGDLVWNGSIYGAYFVVHGASGFAEGHYGDSIQYVNKDGSRQAKSQYSNTWGCSHNEGIAIAPTASQPFLTLCSNDWQTGVYLNTNTRTMSGPKISNDMTTAGYAGEPFGGSDGSYSNVAQFSDGSAMVAWQTHGAASTSDGGEGATMRVLTVAQRWDVHNVAVAPLKDKATPLTTVTLTPGGAGDENVKFITKDAVSDRVNVRTATYSDSEKLALVTYEVVNSPKCTATGTTCTGTYSGTTFQLVDGATGAASGSPFTSTDTFIAGNIVTLPDGSLAWPYVNVAWDLSASASTSKTATSISFAKLKTGNTASTPAPAPASSSASSPVRSTDVVSATSTASAVPTPTEARTTVEQPAPTESTSIDVPVPTESASTEVPAPTEATSTEVPTSTESVTTEAPVPTESATTDVPEPTEPATTDIPVPTEPATTEDPAPTETASTEEPTPTEPTSTEEPTPEPTEATSTDVPEPTESAPTESAPTESAPTESTSTDAPEPTVVLSSSSVASSTLPTGSASPTGFPYPIPTGWPWWWGHGRGHKYGRKNWGKSRLNY